MNSGYSKNSFFDRFRGHLPEILYTKVPVPNFLETPITIPNLFQKQPQRRRTKPPTSTAPSVTDRRNTLEGVVGPGATGLYAINQTDIEIHSGTWIIGDLEYGTFARAKGKFMGGKFLVTQIVFIKR